MVEVCAVSSASGRSEVVQLFSQLLFLYLLSCDRCLVLFDHFVDPVFALFILVDLFFQLL